MPDLNRLRAWAAGVTGSQPGVSAKSVLVIGLGRFGTALAETLGALGIEVMAVDIDQGLVDQWADKIAHVRTADATSSAVLSQLGANSFDAVVVAIGTDIEASVLSTAALADLGVPNIWAKAITSEHGRILERVGAHHVVFPEKEMGERVAHVVTGQVDDYFELDDGFVLAELKAPDELIGKRLADTDLRAKYQVTVVCIKPDGGSYTYATADTVVGRRDHLVIAGSVEAADRFVEKTGR
ncbi:MAG: TrkA family potassium uptake protein [Acidimicrobiia bacterium]|nr:TrkA family potassium uptake protein [Acidimicrobiia bacterium]